MFNTLPANPFPPSSEQMGAGGGGGSYVLPVASADTLGGVKVGEGLEINAETGVLNNTNPTPPTPYTPPSYSTSEYDTGKKWIDGKPIYEKVIANVANEAIIATNVDTIVNVIIARHGASTDANRHVFGDGFTINDGGSIYLDTTTHEAQYAVWASTGGSLDKPADHIIISYTKTESEEN